MGGVGRRRGPARGSRPLAAPSREGEARRRGRSSHRCGRRWAELRESLDERTGRHRARLPPQGPAVLRRGRRVARARGARGLGRRVPGAAGVAGAGRRGAPAAADDGRAALDRRRVRAACARARHDRPGGSVRRGDRRARIALARGSHRAPSSCSGCSPCRSLRSAAGSPPRASPSDPGLRLAGGVVWALAPTLLAALTQGRPTAVLAHLLLPWLFYAGSVAHRSWSGAGAASLLLVAVVASAPSLAPALAVLWVGVRSSSRSCCAPAAAWPGSSGP